MMSELMMLTGYISICAVAMGIFTIFTISSGESMVLSTLFLILCMYLGAVTANLQMAVIAFEVIAVIGLVIWIIKNKRDRRKEFFSPSFALLSLLFVTAMIMFHGDFIQLIDDFHQWAAAVKYIFERGVLPGADFIGDARMPEFTSLYSVYFQVLGGYNEGHMYVSGFFLSAVAILLPLYRLKWKEAWKAVLYVFAVYISFFSLYNHAYKSLYVDIPAAAWSAAPALWWGKMLGEEGRLTRHKALCNVICLGATIAFAIETKWGIGFLLCGFSVIHMIVLAMVNAGLEKTNAVLRKHARVIVIVLIVTLTGMAFAYLLLGERLIPVSGGGLGEALAFKSEKARLTAAAILKKSFKTPLNSGSRIHISAIPTALGFSAFSLWIAAVEKGVKRRRMIFQAIFNTVIFGVYLAALYVTYVSTFAYTESTTASAAHRYFSVIILYLLFLLFGYEAEADAKSVKRLAVWSIVFALGINGKFISSASHWHIWNINSYKQIKTSKERLEKMVDMAGDDSKVYLIDQQEGKVNEFSLCIPLYYREDKISNYLRTPWTFNEDGSKILFSQIEVSVNDLPWILKDGGYQYVWLYRVDEYLTSQLSNVFGYEDEVVQGLYEIVYNQDGNVVGLLYKGMV